VKALRAEAVGRLGARLDDLIDESVGIVSRVWEVARPAGSPDFFHYAALAANTAAFGHLENFANTGGAATRPEIAIAKAVGEAVERYCSAIFDPERLPLTSVDDAAFPCIPPEAFALHSQAQYGTPGFPWAPFTRATPIRWTPTLEAGAERIVYAPAAFTWIPYRYDQTAGETPIGQSISTGQAGHETWAGSALGGLCEVIERDAFTLMWQRRLSLPHIRVETLSASNQDLVQRFETTGDRVSLINLTTDLGVAAVLSVLRSDANGRPAHVFAAAASGDPEAAVRKSLEELAHTRRYSEQILRWIDCPAAHDDFAAVESQVEHLRFAADPSSREPFAFVFAAADRVAFDALPNLSRAAVEDEWEAVAAAVRRAGHAVYVADLTSPDVRSLGLWATRTLAPGLHPLAMGHRLRALGGRRLHEAPERYAGQNAGLDRSLNPYPHPFP
jgi:ribosomal protein S12 methylthiotransferase accessory factor